MSYSYQGAQGPATFTGVGTVGLVTAAETQPSSNALDQHEKSLHSLTAHLENLCQRTASLSARLFGAVPEAVGQSEKPLANPPAIRRLDDLASAAHVSLEALSRHVARLEQL